MFSPSRVLLAASAGLLAAICIGLDARPLDARLAFEDLPLLGFSPGGTPFTRECPDGHVLTGVRYRRGLVLDGLGIRCRPVRPDGTLGPEISAGLMTGGNGGSAGTASCPANTVIASQEGDITGLTLGAARLGCHAWVPGSRSWKGSQTRVLVVKPGSGTPRKNTCAKGSEPATGIRGRHGGIVDAFGLRCGKP